MLDMTDAELAAARSDAANIGVFFRLETDPVVRVWAGVGDIAAPADAYDVSGATYSGLGQLANIPTVDALINGLAQRVTFTMSGVSPGIVASALEESDLVNGKRAALGICFFGSDWQMLSPSIRWLWRGFADYTTADQRAERSGAVPQMIRTIGLSVGTLFTGRRRRGLSYLTDHDQQARSPGDKICERTMLYNQVVKNWPILKV